MSQPPGTGRTGGARLAYATVWLVAALLLLAEVWVHRHAGFPFAGPFGFYAGAGLAAVALIALGGRILSAVVSRGEDYYDR